MKSLHELMNLKGRTAIITGGGGHIGSVMGEALAELGANVALVDYHEEGAKKAAASLQEKYKTEVLALPVDLADNKAIKNIPAIVLEKWKRIDIVINSAAFVGTSALEGWVTPFMEQSPDTYSKSLQVNLTAPFTLIQACTPALQESKHGSVINIGSTYGTVGPNMSLYEGTKMGNPAGYAASKGGLIQLTRWLSTVLAPSIRVNCISPGGVWRNQPESFVARYVEKTPLKRMASEEDFKGAVAYLASDLSNYVTGQNLQVDGGWTIW